MAKQRHLFAFLTIVTVLAPHAWAATGSCTAIEIGSNNCPSVGAEMGDGGVDLTGTDTTPGTGSPGGSPDTDSEEPEGLPFGRDEFFVTGPFTIADIAHFQPIPGVDHMQPDGWMIVGLDTNFYARVSQHIDDGTLLGQPAFVRFTPVAYHWDYGDGSTATRSTRGNTWQALGIDEFDPTPTSHIYRDPGTYYIDLDISFAAEWRLADSDWIPVIGTLRVPANRLVATAGGAKTVLVEEDCRANPSGPGC